jgi:hypothetical protein
VIRNITKIISLQNSSSSFCFDDPNLTRSLNLSNLKHQMTKCVNLTMENLTKNIPDQKSSNLCVPISVTALLRFAIKNDLYFVDKHLFYSSKRILTTLTMIVYPRSFAGLNLNPKKEEKYFQTNDVETLLRRICKKTYLMESGWEIIRSQGIPRPAESTCELKTGIFTTFQFPLKSHFSASQRELHFLSSFNSNRRLYSPRRHNFFPPDGARPR